MITESDDAAAHRVSTYEYRAVPVPGDRLSLTRDTYAAFGWIEEGNPTGGSPLGPLTLSLKRDRHIRNRSMINELQRKSEAALNDIDHLERSKVQKAQIVAFTIGVIGSAFLAGSVFAFQAALWVPFVIFGAVGLVAWVAPFFAYRSIRTSQTSKVAPLIDQRYDTIYDAAERAQRLMAQN